jgi:hypothetical protein
MDAKQFERLFRPTIRVLFDWERLHRLRPRTFEMVVAHIDDLQDWLTPWYLHDGQEGDFRECRSPLRISDVAAKIAALSLHRQQEIRGLATSMTNGASPIVIAAYRFESGTIILDGNHRLAAISLGRLSNSILAVTLVAPRDTRMLPDLANVE